MSDYSYLLPHAEAAPSLEEWRKVPPGHWRTRDGEDVLISKMTDTHLTNVIKHLKPRVQARLSQAQLEASALAAMCTGDMASYYAEKEADNFMMATWCDVLEESAPELADEADRRGIDWRSL